jgi:hypothetical protein
VDRRSYAWWYCPVAGAGACTNGPYAFGDVTLSATPGVTYTVQGYHSVETYYYYYDVDPGCMWGCSQWYDALGYSTGVCSPACQADPFCYCIATTGGASARTYFPPMLLYLAYVANQALGDTSKQSSTPQATLSCTPSVVTRGSNVNCTVTGPGSTRVTNWSFSGGGGNVSGPSGVSSWGGTMVQSGAISAKAAGISLPPQNITVNPRPGWLTQPATALQVRNGGLVVNGIARSLPVPPQQSGHDAGLGLAGWAAPYTLPAHSLISSGPNSGFAYYAAGLNYLSFFFNYIINPDLEELLSTFSQKQYGSCGYISWLNLLTHTHRHEYNHPIQSHHGQYVNAINNHNFNPGLFIEARVAAPGVSLIAFTDETQSGVTSRFNVIAALTAMEPYPVNHNELNSPLGNINYAPYTPCP